MMFEKIMDYDYSEIKEFLAGLGALALIAAYYVFRYWFVEYGKDIRRREALGEEPDPDDQTGVMFPVDEEQRDQETHRAFLKRSDD